MIRAATSSDQSALLELARATGLLEAEELDAFSGMMTECLDGNMPGHAWLVLDNEGITAAAYFAPEMMADRVWNLWFIGVHPDHQGQGQGSTLLNAVEDAVREEGARLLLVETSGTDDMALTRAFYLKAQYDQEARIRDFYTTGDDKIVFRKAF